MVYFLTPYTAVIQDTFLRYAVFLGLMFVKGVVVIVAFPCTTIMLTNSASSVHILGTLNGFATSFSGIGRAIGPAITGAVFTLGVRHDYIIAPWWLLGVIAALGAIPAWFIVEGDGPSGSLDMDSEDEEETLVSNDGESEDEDVALIEGAFGQEGSDSSDELDGRHSKYGTMNSEVPKAIRNSTT